MTLHHSGKTWLGGDPQGKWSNYYELLGLPIGFSDKTVIARVADQLMKRIRVAASQDVDVDRLRGIAKSVLEAKTCLTDSEEKAHYDEELLRQNDSHAATIETAADSSPVNSIADKDIPQAIPVAVPISNAAASVEIESSPFTAFGQASVSRRSRERSRFWLKLGTVVVGVGLFAALALLSKRYLLDNEPLALKRTSVVDATADPAVDSTSTVPLANENSRGVAEGTNATDNSDKMPSGNGNDSSEELPNVLVPHESSRTESDTALVPPTKEDTTPLDREEAEALSSALKAARRSLQVQDFDAAGESLARAHGIARRPKHMELVERLEELTHYAQEYWAAIDDAWNDLSAGIELQVGNTIVIVVEVESEKIKVRVAGGNRRYTRDKLPSGLQKAIIESWLDPSAASSDVIRGAFYATQDPPNNQAAGDHWKLAQQHGAQVEKLTLILTDSYAVDDLIGD